MMKKNSIVIVLLCAIASTTFIQNANSFLFPKPPRVLGVIAFQKKQLKCKLLQKNKRRKQKICLLQKKKKLLLLKKKKFVFGSAVAVAAAGPLVATITAVGGAAAAVAVLNTVETSEIYTPAENSLNGQSILITGGTTGLGLETAKRLSIGRPENLIITSRTQEKGQTAVAAINEYLSENQTTKNNDDDDDDYHTPVNVSYKILDLDSVQGVQDSVAEWLKGYDENDSSLSSFPDQLDVIINNAGVMNIPKLELTIDGIERQMASNHLGHFILTKLLASRLSKKAKVINVSSSAHQFARGDGGIDFDYCWTGSPNYSPWKSYGQSKLANILFSQELQRRTNEAGYDWDVACLHPGVVSTDLWRQSLGSDNYQRLQDFQKNAEDNLPTVITDGFDTILTKTGDLGLFKTVKQGATTSVWLASGGYQNNKEEDLVVRTDAQYYDDRKPQKLGDFAKDKDAAKRLWKESEERAGISFDLLPWSNNENVQSSSVVYDVIVEDEEVVEEIVVEQEVGDVVEEDGKADDDESSADTKDEVVEEIADEVAKEIVDVKEDGETDDDESSTDTEDETK
jgi:NAD(P)-dependent dehydrogenase (short-subunit alcohol dehydrogenase family)